ncbi:ParB N-terminal domain-containing protein [Gluconacetobacter diazotrophicus]|uniref:ParB N-terminal domain-containing protein n=1 Tax=Gluconacetobacter diazotrophicus TaxID=33996 RepID=A0A7W4NGJ7_GLUDI|nr:ParB N-terminal domain-containing protein [Gluconacetobacter diazotrophicus]MBB2157349.1 ParB N-terminal domain-containing protein [Gluconacetobacter diazotrophicus]
MELRSVDPKTLRQNPANPRTSAPNPAEDRKLALNMQVVGVLQPPIVREDEDGGLTVLWGNRRARCAVMARLKQIQVLVKAPDENLDDLAAGSENVIRQAMSRPDEWRWVEKLRREKKLNDKQIAKALMQTPAYIKGLSRLARLHPPMLHAIEIGRGPGEGEEQIIAMASLEEQRAIWGELFAESVEEGQDPAEYLLKPDDAEDTVPWRHIALQLKQTRFYACNARFDGSVANAYGIGWEEDLFTPAGEDGRYTTDSTAFEAGQRHWLAHGLPDGGIAMATNDYGSAVAPEGYRRLGHWIEPTEDEVVGYCLDPHSLKITEVRLGADSTSRSTPVHNSISAGAPQPEPKVRADISGTGEKLIGEIRTQALHQALDAARETVDPWDLIAALLLAVEGANVVVHGDPTGGYRKTSARKTALGALFPEGLLVRDPALLRIHAVAVLKSLVNCDVSTHSGSGLIAQVMGLLFDADARMPNMAFEEFLKTFSKPGITRAIEAEGLAAQSTGKEMRAALIAHVGEARWLPPAAGFAQAADAWKAELEKQARFEARHAAYDDDDDDNSDNSDEIDDVDDETGEPLPNAAEPGTAAEDGGEEETEDQSMAAVAAHFAEQMASDPETRAHFDSHVEFLKVA